MHDQATISTLSIRVAVLEKSVEELRDRAHSHATALALLVNVPGEARDMEKDIEDLRGDARDLKQLIASYDRIRIEEEKLQKLQVAHANQQRERIEKKIDRVMGAIAAVLLSSLAFFLVQHFAGTA